MRAVCRPFTNASSWGLILALSAGCAESLSSFRPAHVAEPGSVQLASGIDIEGSVSGGITTEDTGDTALLVYPSAGLALTFEELWSSGGNSAD